MRVTDNDVTNAVIRLFLRTGRDVIVEQIAEELGCSESIVYKRIRETHGAPNQCSAIALNGRRYGYRPHPSTLRTLINNAVEIIDVLLKGDEADAPRRSAARAFGAGMVDRFRI